jgi:hypothetical protein
MSLFVKSTAVAYLRANNLLVAATGALPNVTLTDDYIWNSLLAAEDSIARQLRVYLQPTIIIPDDAPAAEVAALAGGSAAWAQEAAYDYTSEFFQGDQWGLIVTKQRPIISVQSISFNYPNPQPALFSVPTEWIRLSKKYGQINLVPQAAGYNLPLPFFLLQAMTGGRTIPFMVQVRYTAGLTDAMNNWPDLINVIYKQAVLNIIGDVFLPQSGSISADGLSQSMSTDMGVYADWIDRMLNGGKGANGGLMAAIHGIRIGFTGGA